ncbi:hypothetical protein Q5O89_16920 [Peribacillus frigoritolerans]|nr:hypothetical protein [Peribacillus frigoritolerans]
MKLYIVIDSANRVVANGTTFLSMDGFNTYEIEVEENHEIITNPSLFIVKDGAVIKDESHLLEKLKKEKGEELNQACKESILKGFNHTINGIEYHFSLDVEAQFNFQGAKDILYEGLVQEIMWTVQKDGQYTRIPLTKEIMSELILVILQHKDNNISRYRDFLCPFLKDVQL